ncbi:hypothetical protein J6590_021056 [Homalodisca vitripennis]|nr:hypothetical protein J6590_021056 [Homalodisca vitripennis]
MSTHKRGYMHLGSTLQLPIPFKALFCPPSWATGLCEDLIKRNKGESRYSASSIVLIKSAMVTDRV